VDEENTPAGTAIAYGYDYENRLIQVTLPGATAQYKYDPFGRRIEKSVNNVVTRYLYDGPNIVTEYDGNGNVQAQYTHNLAVDDPLSVQQGASTYYYHKDGLGSVTALTNPSGNVVKRYRYRGFGEIYSESGALVQPYTFTAREKDPETGLYYYRTRYYDPKAGRFINKDPIGFVGGDANFYRYVLNDPLNDIDPFGLKRRPLTRSNPFPPMAEDLLPQTVTDPDKRRAPGASEPNSGRGPTACSWTTVNICIESSCDRGPSGDKCPRISSPKYESGCKCTKRAYDLCFVCDGVLQKCTNWMREGIRW
jgi:RHS repeat-associated protein